MTSNSSSAGRRLLWLALASAIVMAPPPAMGQGGRTRLTLADAAAIIAAAQQSAASMDARVSIAVVDQRGDLIALERLTGANPASADGAIGKAMTSAILLGPSGRFSGRGNNPLWPALNDSTAGRIRYVQGAVPVIRGGLILGAVAAGGANSTQQDEAIATAGAAVIP